MGNYKSVRLEEQVYQELAKWQLPRESISQTLERLLNIVSRADIQAATLQKILKEGL